MARKVQRTPFAEFVDDPTWSESAGSRTGRHAPLAGGFNVARSFFDQDGRELRCVADDITVEQAQRAVDDGAAVAWEDCGCGGYTGCQPQWLAPADLRRLRGGASPVLGTKKRDRPTWLDLWRNDAGTVVLAHGAVTWGGSLGP